jgi:hypothetical protein
MTTPENSRSRSGGVDSHFFPHLFREMTCCGFKNDSCKKSGDLLFSAKLQNHPGSNEIGRNLHKIQKIPPKSATTK